MYLEFQANVSYSLFEQTSQTVAVWNVEVPAAVRVTVEHLDCQPVRETMSSQTSDGHTTTRLIQTCYAIPYKRSSITDTT